MTCFTRTTSFPLFMYQPTPKPKGNCDLSCSDSIPRNIISCELVAKPLRLRARRATQRMRLMRGGCAGDKRGLCGERFCLIGMFERVIVCFGRNEIAPIISHLWRGSVGRASVPASRQESTRLVSPRLSLLRRQRAKRAAGEWQAYPQLCGLTKLLPNS